MNLLLGLAALNLLFAAANTVFAVAIFQLLMEVRMLQDVRPKNHH